MTGAIAFLASFLFVGAVRRYALARALLDRPNERSSHSVPTPRGGGLGLVAAILLIGAACLASVRADVSLTLALLAVVLTATIGWVDDRRPMTVGPRMAAQIMSALLVLPMAMAAVAAPVPPWLLAAVLVLAVVSAINVVNFMDGIDALIGLQTTVFGAHLAFLAAPGTEGRTFGVILAAAALGFLVWNWAPARIFLGDVGSGALGVLGVIGGLLVLRDGGWPVIAVFIPLFPLVLDAAVTLTRRAARGERLTQAHRSHLYQRLANGGWGHTRVSLVYAAAAFVASMLVLGMPRATLPIWAIAYCAVIGILGVGIERRARSAARETEAGSS